MRQRLNVSKAAQLVGVSRSEIQGEIRSGKLTTFEGEVAFSDLQKVYPEVSLENTTVLERISRIQENAVSKQQNFEPLSPQELLDEINRLRYSLNEAHAEIKRYHKLVAHLSERVVNIQQNDDCTRKQKLILQALLSWIFSQLEQRA